MDAVDERNETDKAANAVCKKDQGGVVWTRHWGSRCHVPSITLIQGAPRQDKSTEVESRLAIDAEVISTEGH